MKIRSITLFIVVLCSIFVGCGDSEPKRPIDYPGTSWCCEAAKIIFSVAEDGRITDATMADKNGETISISLVFTDMSEGKVSITNADGSETYLSGTCQYGEDIFSIFVTDIYSPDINITSTRLAFERK